MAKTMSSKEAAQKWKCTQAEVTQWCREGKIPGAFKDGSKQTSAWQIPADAMKPGTAAAKEKIENPPDRSSETIQPSRRSGLSIAAGVLLLISAVLQPIQNNLSWEILLTHPLTMIQLLLSVVIAILLFMGHSGNMLTIVMGANLALVLVMGPASILTQGPLACMFVLLLPPIRTRRFSKLWALPFALGAVIVFIGMFGLNTARAYSNWSRCLEVWAYLFMGAWLAHPDMTFKSLFLKDINHMVKAGDILAALFLRGWVTYGSVLMVIFLFVIPLSGVGLSSPFAAPCILVFSPLMGSGASIYAGLKEAREATKIIKRSISEVNARSGIRGVSERAQAELNKEAGKKAQKEVIKSAIVGGVIAGDAGAVVGAMSAKAKQDAASGGASPSDSKAASKEVIKGAVVGGVIAGDAGAIVGAAAAKAGQEAKNKTDKTK